MAISHNILIKKIMMALTGLFLSFFLLIHLGGNLQLLLPESQAHEQFNAYSHFLSGLLLIKIIAFLLYATILYHVFDAMLLIIGNWRANNMRGYKNDHRREVSGWASRNMGFVGTIIFIFLVLHFKDYWYIYKFGELPVDAAGNKDLYAIVVASFNQLWYVAIYVIAVIGLGIHLWHGVSSAFRTFGLYHERYMRWIKYIGYAYAVLLTMGFSIIPIISYIKQL